MSDLAKLFDSDAATRATYELSKLAFAQFADNNIGDPLPPLDCDAMQVRLARWQNTFYGPQPDAMMALGMIEEEIETFVADEDPALGLDGLGDVQVYASQLCTNNRLAIAPIIDLARLFTRRTDIRPILAVGVLAQVVLKGAQKIRGLDQRERYRLRLVGAIAMTIAKAIDDVEIMHPETIPVKASGVFCIVGEEVLQRAAGHPSIPQENPIVNVNVTIQHINVDSDDPDRFALGMVEAFERQKRNTAEQAMSNLQQAAAMIDGNEPDEMSASTKGAPTPALIPHDDDMDLQASSAFPPKSEP